MMAWLRQDQPYHGLEHAEEAGPASTRCRAEETSSRESMLTNNGSGENANQQCKK